MKIRTDFVTNSSSSSFYVYLTVVSTDEKQFGATFIGRSDEYAMNYIDVNAEELLEKKNINDLLDMLMDSVYTDFQKEYDNFLYDGSDKDEPEAFAECCERKKKYEGKIAEMKKRLCEEIPTIDKLKKIYIEEINNAYGEASLSTLNRENIEAANYDKNLQKVLELAIEIDKLTGKEREDKKIEMENLLDQEIFVEEEDFYHNEKKDVRMKIQWRYSYDDIEDFVADLVNGTADNYEIRYHGKKIDFLNKEIKKKNMFWLYTRDDGIEKFKVYDPDIEILYDDSSTW